jgi:hypothetical protein
MLKKISKTQRMPRLQPLVDESGAAAVAGTRIVFGGREAFRTSGTFRLQRNRRGTFILGRT